MTLPWPPSVNTYWRHPTRGPLAGRHLISERGREYRNLVADHIGVNSNHQLGSARLAIMVFAHPPDKRRRDLDNILKALLDSLAHAGVIEDDSQFDAICIVRRDVQKNGKLQLFICETEKL